MGKRNSYGIRFNYCYFLISSFDFILIIISYKPRKIEWMNETTKLDTCISNFTNSLKYCNVIMFFCYVKQYKTCPCIIFVCFYCMFIDSTCPFISIYYVYFSYTILQWSYLILLARNLVILRHWTCKWTLEFVYLKLYAIFPK